jgi:hypothetical protein
MYWYVLKLACFWCLIIFTIATVAQVFAGGIANGTALLEALLRVPWSLIPAAAVVTLVFAAIEFGITRNPPICGPFAGAPLDWSPATLPPADGTAGKKPRSFALALVEVIFGFLFLAWWLLVPEHPWLLLGPGALYLHASPFQLAPVWIPFYWWVVAINLLQLGWRCVNLARGRWQGPRRVQQNAIQALGLIPLALVIAAPGHAYVTLKHSAVNQGVSGAQLAALNHGIYIGLLLICVIAVAHLLWEMGRFALGAYRERATAVR